MTNEQMLTILQLRPHGKALLVTGYAELRARLISE